MQVGSIMEPFRYSRTSVYTILWLRSPLGMKCICVGGDPRLPSSPPPELTYNWNPSHRCAGFAKWSVVGVRDGPRLGVNDAATCSGQRGKLGVTGGGGGFLLTTPEVIVTAARADTQIGVSSPALLYSRTRTKVSFCPTVPCSRTWSGAG